MKKNAIRVLRKSAHIGGKVFKKGARLSAKVEEKTTRILSGTDYSMSGVHKSIPLEKIYYNTLPAVTPLNPAMPAVGSEPSVTLLLPSLKGSSFYGGTATALVVAAKIAKLAKLRLRIVQTLETGHASNLEAFFAREGIEFSNDDIQIISVAGRSYNVYGYIGMHPEDIYVASAWWDAYLIGRLPLTKKFVYLIQDFEPIFYNNSDSYVLAENTYKQPNYIALCNTKLMYDFMADRKYEAFNSANKPAWFEPAVSRKDSGMAKTKPAGQKKRLFLYGRPNVHRNLFFTALNAIDYAFSQGYLDKDEWECFMAGQDSLPAIDLPSRVQIRNLGKMRMEEYVEFSKTVDVAVSPMMAPHPNYPTLEFASIGTGVVTTKYANKTNLSNYSKNIVMSDIDVKSMAGAIRIAASKSYAERLEVANANDISGDWSKSLNDSLKAVIKSL